MSTEPATLAARLVERIAPRSPGGGDRVRRRRRWPARRVPARALRRVRPHLGPLSRGIRAGVEGPAVVTPADVERVVRSRRGRGSTRSPTRAGRTFRSTTASWLHPEMWRLAVAHARRGHRVVLVSRATRAEIDPIAAELGADDVIATRVSVTDGEDRGGSVPRSARGATPPPRPASWADDHHVDLAASFAYGTEDDRPLLDLVGNLGDGRRTGGVRRRPARRARAVPSRRWGRSAGTLGFYGGFFAASAAAAGSGLLHGSRHHAINLAGSLGSEFALGVAGVDVEVEGAEHLWAQRPAIFVFNHQSKLDPIVIMTLLRHDFTGVGEGRGEEHPACSGSSSSSPTSRSSSAATPARRATR